MSLSAAESAGFETTKIFVTSKMPEFVSVSTSVMISVSPVRMFVTVTEIVSTARPLKFWSESRMIGMTLSPSLTFDGKVPFAATESHKTVTSDEVKTSAVS